MAFDVLPMPGVPYNMTSFFFVSLLLLKHANIVSMSTFNIMSLALKRDSMVERISSVSLLLALVSLELDKTKNLKKRIRLKKISKKSMDLNQVEKRLGLGF